MHITLFRIYFPVIEDRGLELQAQLIKMGQIPKGEETLLLVDDEKYLRDLGKRMLTRHGYTVLTASDGEMALQKYREKGKQISLVILDLIMPGMGGESCLDLMLKDDPAAKVIVASGFSVDEATRQKITATARAFIGKPLTGEEKRSQVQRIAEQYNWEKIAMKTLEVYEKV